MTAETPPHAAESIYAATGIAGLDAVLGGGALRRHLYAGSAHETEKIVR